MRSSKSKYIYCSPLDTLDNKRKYIIYIDLLTRLLPIYNDISRIVYKLIANNKIFKCIEENAIMQNNFDLIKYVYDNSTVNYYESELCEFALCTAIKCNNLKYIMYFYKKLKYNFHNYHNNFIWVVRQAITYNNLELIKYFHNDGVKLGFYSYDVLDEVVLDVKYLIDINIFKYLHKNNVYICYLHTIRYAIKVNYIELIKYLCKIGMDVKFKRISILMASEYGKLDIVKYLLENGVDVNVNTILYNAIRYGQLEIVKYLHKNGADITYNITMHDIVGSIISKHLDIIEYLYENGIDIGPTHGPNYVYYFQYSMFNINEVNIQIQQARFPNQEPTIKIFNYILLEATNQGKLKLIKHLYEYFDRIYDGKKYSITYKDELLIAIKKGHIDILKYLLTTNNSIHVPVCDLLQTAIYNNKIDAVRLICEKLYISQKDLDMLIFDIEYYDNSRVKKGSISYGIIKNGHIKYTSITYYSIKNNDIYNYLIKYKKRRPAKKYKKCKDERSKFMSKRIHIGFR
jgi:ankyrin repeat protein